MADAFFLLDEQWRFRYLNREAERLLATPRSELLGQVGLGRPPGRRPARRTSRSTAGPSRPATPVRFEQSLPGAGRHFEVRAHPGPDGLAVYFADVSERVAAERERDRALARLALLNAIGAALTATFDVDVALTRLADLLVPALADVCTIDLRDGDDVRGSREVVTTASDPRKAEALHARRRAARPPRTTPARRCTGCCTASRLSTSR